jgi:hypothetical protein
VSPSVVGQQAQEDFVPDDEPTRPGKQCSEASMPAYHWAHDATAAVYHVAT